MSKHSTSRSPACSASASAPPAPPAGPDSTVSAACAAASGALDQPAGGLHHGRFGQAGLRGALGEPAQVAREQRRQRGVDLGRRRALVLAEGANDLVAQRDVNVRQASLQLAPE